MATPDAKFPFTIVDETGRCQPMRPPHPPMDHCTPACNHQPPGHDTWDSYNQAQQQRTAAWRSEARRLHTSDLAVRLALVKAGRPDPGATITAQMVDRLEVPRPR
jgi:hypothetical protein